MTRQYVPEVGKLVKMREWSDYTSRNLSLWSWFRVHGLTEDSIGVQSLCKVSLAPLPNDPTKDEKPITIPLSCIAPPLGWEERYTIYVSPAKEKNVFGWLKRGIAVRANHYIGDPSGSSFQPLDNCEQPDWKRIELTDKILPEQTADLIRIVRFEQEYDVSVPAPCQYCTKGKLNYNGLPCTSCDGHGNGKRWLSQLTPKERNKAIQVMQADGWTVRYQRRGMSWIRERETVVKEFGQHA